jgi:hypothetical protein
LRKSSIVASRRTSPWRTNGLGDLLEDEVGIQPHAVALGAHPRLRKELDGLGEDELDAELADDPLPPALERLDRVGREDLVARQLVDEHAAPEVGGWVIDGTGETALDSTIENMSPTC